MPASNSANDQRIGSTAGSPLRKNVNAGLGAERLRRIAQDFVGTARRQCLQPILAMGRRIYYQLLHHGPNWYTCLSALSPRTRLDGAVEWSRTTDLLITNQLLFVIGN